jgi:methyl-accepting chemotaxis protein
MTGVILTFSILFTLYLSRDLTSKLTLMKGAFRNISHGDFSKKLNITSKDEFGTFTITFNELMNDLKENVNNILNLTRDIGSFISDKSEITDLYNLVAEAVVQDTSADISVVLNKAEQIKNISSSSKPVIEEVNEEEVITSPIDHNIDRKVKPLKLIKKVNNVTWL